MNQDPHDFHNSAWDNFSFTLQNLAQRAGAYHVHQYPLPYKYDKDSDQCGQGSVGGHYNPLGATVPYVPVINTAGTQELFEVCTG